MMWHKWTKKSFIDVMKLGCAILLTAAPWIFGLDGENIATWNAWLNGSVIALIAVAALVYEAEWEPETTLGVGLWVALSPYIIGFMQDATATLVHDWSASRPPRWELQNCSSVPIPRNPPNDITE